MSDTLLKPDLVQFDLDVESQAELFRTMAEKLVDAGYVRQSFADAIAARERKYPTALPTKPEAIAIPHTDAKHIEVPFIAPIRLRTPVAWVEMGNDEMTHPVRLVFMLGLNKADGQVKVLQALTTKFQEPDFYARAESAGSPEEFFDIVGSIEGLDT